MALNRAPKRGELEITKPTRGKSASVRFKEDGRKVKKGKDVDHIIDLQLGGKDELSNMRLLDRSVNRNLGSQIHHQIKHHPLGTKILSVKIK